jgi:hypothetical protein
MVCKTALNHLAGFSFTILARSGKRIRKEAYRGNTEETRYQDGCLQKMMEMTVTRILYGTPS